jgi:hypothetical protein
VLSPRFLPTRFYAFVSPLSKFVDFIKDLLSRRTLIGHSQDAKHVNMQRIVCHRALHRLDQSMMAGMVKTMHTTVYTKPGIIKAGQQAAPKSC